MSFRPRPLVLGAIIALGAVAFLLWSAHRRVDRIDAVTTLGEPVAAGSASRTGFHRLIIPEHHEPSFHWIAQTERMIEAHSLHWRHVDYDNAPAGHATTRTSPYRWWLGSITSLDHFITGAPLVAAIETGARWSDPLLLVLGLIVGTMVIGVRFGAAPAAVFALAVVALFPFGTEFLPGMPDGRGLAIVFAFASIALLAAGVPDPGQGTAPAGSEFRSSRWFAAAAVAGGLGIWTSAAVEIPILIGAVSGGMLASATRRSIGSGAPAATTPALPWRIWGLWGGGTVLVASVIEYAPNHFPGWHRNSLHPLAGLAWIVAGQALHQIDRPPQNDGKNLRRRMMFIGTAIGLALLPFAAWFGNPSGFLERGVDALRLARVPGAPWAENAAAWAARDAGTVGFWAAIAPFVAVLAVVLITWRRASLRERIQVVMTCAPLLVAGALALFELRWWAVADAMLIVLAVLETRLMGRAGSPAIRWSAAGMWLGVLGLGLAESWPAANTAKQPVTGTEAHEIIERNLAQWLAIHAGESRPIVYAPPRETLALTYYGNLRGIGTFDPDNEAGFRASVLLAGATTLEAAQALLQAHQVRYIVIPSWDSYFDDFARLYVAGGVDRPSLLVRELRRMNLPPWVRPVAYQMPPIGGLEHEWVLVFEIVEDQTPVVATSRLAEYLVEIGDLERAAAVGEALERFPGNVGALAALAQVQASRGDSALADATSRTLITLVAAGGDRNLPWDRRVSVAIALARADRVDLARVQTRHCVAQMDEARLRALPTGELYNLVVLIRALNLPPKSPRLTQLALDLLPPDMRKELPPP